MVMGDITRIDTVQQYCDLFEVEALHPLVSVVNCYEVQPIRHSKKLYNIYAVLLKDTDCGTMNYGRSLYDYEKGSMLFIAPGQVMGSDDDGSLHQPAGWALMFHPELLRGTSLAHIIKEYSYFSYNANEALHLSEQERKVVIECINNVAEELRHPIDKHSRSLIIDTMKLLLDRCIRKFKPDMPSKEDLNQIIEAGLYAASGMGKQAAIIVAVTNKELRDKLSEMNRRIGGWEKGFDPFYGAPAVLVVLADKNCPTHVYDGSLVMGNMMLEAKALDLGNIWIHRAKEEFELPEYKQLLKDLGVEGEWEGIGHCVVGYADGDLPKAAPRKENRVFWVE